MTCTPLNEKIAAAMKDEEEAAKMYEQLAEEFDSRGLPVHANTLRLIATDEHRHRYELILIDRVMREMAEMKRLGKQV